MAWFVHHLDLIDHYIFQFFQTFIRKCVRLYKKNIDVTQNTISKFVDFSNMNKKYYKVLFNNKYSINKINK